MGAKIAQRLPSDLRRETSGFRLRRSCRSNRPPDVVAPSSLSGRRTGLGMIPSRSHAPAAMIRSPSVCSLARQTREVSLSSVVSPLAPFGVRGVVAQASPIGASMRFRFRHRQARRGLRAALDHFLAVLAAAGDADARLKDPLGQSSAVCLLNLGVSLSGVVSPFEPCAVFAHWASASGLPRLVDACVRVIGRVYFAFPARAGCLRTPRSVPRGSRGSWRS